MKKVYDNVSLVSFRRKFTKIALWLDSVDWFDGRRSRLAKYKVFLGEREKSEAKRGDGLSPVP